jgi:hypothetical protein
MMKQMNLVHQNQLLKSNNSNKQTNTHTHKPPKNDNKIKKYSFQNKQKKQNYFQFINFIHFAKSTRIYKTYRI